MKFGEFRVFEDWKDLEKELNNNVKILFGLKDIKINKEGKEIQLCIEGKLPKTLLEAIKVEAKDLSDYEGLNPETKVPCKVFKTEHTMNLCDFIFGFKGRFKEIPLEDQDETTSNIETELYYLRNDSLDSSLNDVISEIVEEKMAIVDSTDPSDTIYEELLDMCYNLSKVIGNNNLCEEAKDKILDAAFN